MSWISSVFSWFKSKEQTGNPTRSSISRRPRDIDYTESLPVNKALTYGLYHNNYPGLKLAGAMAFTPIAIPVWFMGVPTPIAEDEAMQEEIDALVERMYRRMVQLHISCHRDGTQWVFPRYSAREQRLIWEFIDDESVVDIIRDLDTMEPIEIITDDEITLTVGENKVGTIRRKRYFTKQKITVQYVRGTASVPQELRDQTMRNPIGVLPIAFSNNADGDETRGHSDYERIVTDLKGYHDLEYKRDLCLTKFEPKLSLLVHDVDTWLANNGESKDSVSTLDLNKRDLLFRVAGEEADYLYPERAYEAYERALEKKFLKIVEGSGMPEMIWGPKMAGNHASAEEQMANVVKFVEDKRDQKNDAYTMLFSASLALLNITTMEQASAGIRSIEWNSLDALSDKVKSEIFKNFTEGLKILVDGAGATKEMLFDIWQKFFPGIVPEKVEDFIAGIGDMAKFKQFREADYAIAADMTGGEELDIDLPDDEQMNRLRIMLADE